MEFAAKVKFFYLSQNNHRQKTKPLVKKKRIKINLFEIIFESHVSDRLQVTPLFDLPGDLSHSRL